MFIGFYRGEVCFFRVVGVLGYEDEISCLEKVMFLRFCREDSVN